MILEVFAAVVLATAPRSVTLEQVREESRANVSVRTAELEQARALQQVRASQSSIYPQLSAGFGGNGTYGRNFSQFALDPSVDPNQDINRPPETIRGSFDMDVSVTQLLYDGGKWWNQIAQASSNASAAQGRTEEQRLASELEGIRRFYDLFRAQKTLEVLETSVARSAQQLDRARALFEAGRGQKGDAFAAQVNLGNDRLEVVRQRARIVDAQTKLAAWIGRDGVTPLIAQTPAAFEETPVRPPTLEDALTAARSARPLLRALSDQVRAAGQGADVARSGFLPQVSVRGSAGRLGPTLAPDYTNLTREHSVQGGLSLRWNLFNGFITDSQVQQANIARRIADAELAQAERELEGEIRSSVALLRSQLEAVEISRANAQIAADALALGEERFKAGAGSTLEVRDAQLKLTQAELQLLQNRIDVEIARAALERVMGTGVGP